MRSIRALELVRSRRSLILEFVTPVDSKSTVPRDLEARARGHLVLRALARERLKRSGRPLLVALRPIDEKLDQVISKPAVISRPISCGVVRQPRKTTLIPAGGSFRNALSKSQMYLTHGSNQHCT